MEAAGNETISATQPVARRSLRFADPASSRGGRRFEPVEERELHGLVATVALGLPGASHEVVVVGEPPGPIGLPDFVAMVGCAGWLDDRLRAGVPPILSEIECSVLAAVTPRRPLGTDAIARRLAWRGEDVTDVLQRLSKVDAVQLSKSGAATLNPALEPDGMVFAIEAKLKDWKKAVQQGRSYRTWADNYVLVLGGIGAAAAERAAITARHDGAGLFVDGKWLARPRSRRASPARRLQGFEHLFAALASDPSF